MEIKIDNSKPVLVLNQEPWKSFFEKKGYRVPEDEQQFRQVMRNKNLSIMPVSDAIKNITKWNSDDLDEECPSKEQKVEKFLSLYQVIYEEPPIAPEETKMTVSQAKDFLLTAKRILVTEDKIDCNRLLLHDGESVTVRSNFEIKCSIPNISRRNVWILNLEQHIIIAAMGEIISENGKDVIIMNSSEILFSDFEGKSRWHLALPEFTNQGFTGNVYCREIEIQLQKEEPEQPDVEEHNLSLDEAKKFLHTPSVNLIPDNGNINCKAPVLYQNKSITVNSNFRIQCRIPNISRHNIFLLNQEMDTVIAVGEVISKEGKDLIVMDRNEIDFSAFEKKAQFQLALLEFKNQMLTGNIYYKTVKIEMQAMEKSDRVLCIDFGTSNTMAGSYRIWDEFSYEPELVSFADVTNENMLVNYFPTIVFVEDCSVEGNVQYQFGFEAKKAEKEGNYETAASIFYQIKRWLIEDSTYEDTIHICDTKGNSATVKKNDIVRAYLKHVIGLAEDCFSVEFHELHFTAPVKMKYKFLHVLKKILPEYTIIDEKNSVDEAGAILFGYIADKFMKWDKESEDFHNVAVIDCGGGTTDLATCEYRFSESDTNKQIKQIQMNTRFTSGDFNFGGNNITYKIMQLIKLKTAVKYRFITEEDFNKVLSRSENEILLNADEMDYDNQRLYQDFLDMYERCEQFIPTKFNAMSEELFDDDIPKIKRNFYYLWNFAEQVKIIFYREEKVVLKSQWDDAIESISNLKLNYLYRFQGDFLERIESPLDDLEISINEIRKVIFGEIYNLLNRVLPESEYEYYRLSGQSCKINLFNELLKEFIPGKRLRARMEYNTENISSISLKKHCIDGSILYMMYHRLNMHAKLKVIPQTANRIYQIYFADLIGEFPAEDKKENFLKLYPIKSDLDEITVIVRDKNKIIRKVNVSAKVSVDKDAPTKYTSPDGVIKKLKNSNDNINWEKTCQRLADHALKNNVSGQSTFIAAVPAGMEEGYGFYIHFVRKVFKAEEEYYIVTDGRYYNYESTGADFFDGMR